MELKKIVNQLVFAQQELQKKIIQNSKYGNSEGNMGNEENYSPQSMKRI